MNRKDRKLAEMYGMIMPVIAEKPSYKSMSAIGKVHPTKKAHSPEDYKSIDVVEEIIVGKNATKCLWVRAFDNHFNISCTNKTNERAKRC